MHPSSSANSGQQQHVIGKTHLDEQQQALLALQQIGALSSWPVQSLLQNIGRGQEQQQQADFFKQFMKTQTRQSGGSLIGGDQQQRMEREISQKRPSLIHDFGGNSAQSQSTTRYSLIQPHLQQVQMNQSPSDFGLASTSEASYLTEEEEKYKRVLNERLEKIDRERSQAAAMQKNAEKKAKACEKLLAKASQEPTFLSGIDDSEDNEDGRGDGQSPAEALIERIYAENRRKAALAAPFPAMSADRPPHTTNRELMAEDAARLAAEYERSVQLLPSLVQAMRIQRERRQDALERRRIIYEEQLAAWERKVAIFEKGQKKLTRDLKHRELFEKTFIELKKMREEKERNNRVERTRFSLTQGGNGIGPAPPSASSAVAASPALMVKVEEAAGGGEAAAADLEEAKLESQHEIDEKAYAGALVPPVFSNPPRRFFDNRNGIVENAFAESRTQLEAFQNAWSDTEKAIFSEKIQTYGKNFAAIAAFIPMKSVKECIQYYYMTKKRINYKQKFGRRRKKIGRQGYRPPVMPRFGDTDENLQNYSKGCTFVECLLCDSRILLLESLSQQAYQREQHFAVDDFYQLMVNNSQSSHQQEMPICTKCQTQTQRNKTLNRCPMGSCICVGGKRKMKPARNLPEKFAQLGVDHKRFIIYRLKMPPSANKCCTNCFKRITKDVEELLLGDLQSEFESFQNRTSIRKQQQPPPNPTLIVDGMMGEEGDENAAIEGPKGLDAIWAGIVGEGQPPMKELKLNEPATWREVKKELTNEEKEEGIQEGKQQPLLLPQGSITKGTPNRTRNTLIGSINEEFEQAPAATLFGTTNKQEESLSGAVGQQNERRTIEELTTELLSQFAIQPSNSSRETAAAELSRQLSGMLVAGSLPAEWLHSLHTFQQQQTQQTATSASTSTILVDQPPEIVATTGTTRRDSETMRRKSGLATALLPSPLPPETSSCATNANTAAATRLATPSRPSAISPAATSLRPGESAASTVVADKEKPLLEQRDSNLTTNSNDTAPKTESTQGQLSSCYESLSEDSDEEKSSKMGEKLTASTLPPSQQPPPPVAPALPTTAFFTVFDFQDDEPSPETSLAAKRGGQQMVASPQRQRQTSPLAVPNSYFQTKTSTGTAIGNATTDDGDGKGQPIYEPLSSDEEG